MEGFDREMRGIARIIGFIFATGALLFVVAAAVFAGVVWKYEQDLPDYTQLKNYEPPVMTRVHAADGSLLAEYSRERRLYLPSDEIPALVKEAFISAEDKNFYSHWGVDPEGIVRAGLLLLARLPTHPGRLDHHPAGGEELSFELGPNFRPQDPRDPAEHARSSPPTRRKRSSNSTSTRFISAFPTTASPRRRSIISTSRCTS